MKKHVLIVDDDPMIQKIVSYLTTQGLNLRTSQVDNGAQMTAVLKHDRVDLLILDLNLPDEDGLVLARQVRSRRNLPILVLTGDETKETLISALELGVNDFVRKPFDPYELQLRIRNLIAQQNVQRNTAQNTQTTPIQIGPHVLSIAERLLQTASKQVIDLTHNEMNILICMAQANGRPLSRGSLLDAIANGPDAPSERAIDVYIRQLRKKLEEIPERPTLILSVRGFGYKLNISK